MLDRKILKSKFQGGKFLRPSGVQKTLEKQTPEKSITPPGVNSRKILFFRGGKILVRTREKGSIESKYFTRPTLYDRRGNFICRCGAPHTRAFSNDSFDRQTRGVLKGRGKERVGGVYTVRETEEGENFQNF